MKDLIYETRSSSIQNVCLTLAKMDIDLTVIIKAISLDGFHTRGGVVLYLFIFSMISLVLNLIKLDVFAHSFYR